MNMLKTTMLLAALTALFMALGYTLGGSGGAIRASSSRRIARCTALKTASGSRKRTSALAGWALTSTSSAGMRIITTAIG